MRKYSGTNPPKAAREASQICLIARERGPDQGPLQGSTRAVYRLSDLVSRRKSVPMTAVMTATITGYHNPL